VLSIIADERGRNLQLPMNGQRPKCSLSVTQTLFEPMDDDYQPLHAVVGTNGNRYLVASEHIRYDPRMPQRFVVIAYALPENEIAGRHFPSAWKTWSPAWC